MRTRLRSAAESDVDGAIEYYLREAGRVVAADFIDESEAAIAHLSQHPLTGSLRFAYELEIPELRCWRVRRFSYLILYVASDEHLDVWRVLHARRDIPASFASD